MMMEQQKTVPDENLFVMVALLAKKMGKTPLNHRLFIHRLDPNWTVVINGCDIEKGFKDYRIPPGHCLVEYDDWPAGLFTPHGGFFKQNPEYPEANEKAFIRAIKYATDSGGG